MGSCSQVRRRVWDSNTFQVRSIYCVKLCQTVLDIYTDMDPSYGPFTYPVRKSICGLHFPLEISMNHFIDPGYPKLIQK